MCRRLLRWAVGLALGLALTIFASSAHAYPWMIRHGYTGCTPVPHRPFGRRGRADGVRARAERPSPAHALRRGHRHGRGRPTSGFLWGWRPMPEQLRLGGDFREAYFSNQVEGAPVQQQLITMRADLYGDIKVGRFRAAGSIGYVPAGRSPGVADDGADGQPRFRASTGSASSSTTTAHGFCGPAASRCLSGSG